MNPRWSLSLRAAAFGSSIACEGSQLAMVIGLLGAIVPEVRWYASDVVAQGGISVWERSPQPTLVGDTSSIVVKLSSVVQFESGVFSGVPAGIAAPVFREGGAWTEDEEMAELGDAIVEVRAFDTSYISVDGVDLELRDTFRGRFFARTTQGGPTV